MQNRYELAAIVILLTILRACGPLTNANDIIVANPKQAVIDARKLITAHQNNPDDLELTHFKPQELPESLQIPDLMFCRIVKDHLELILARNPDNSIGARIWSQDSKTQHKDQPTKYPEIYFFSYNNDTPESPENIP